MATSTTTAPSVPPAPAPSASTTPVNAQVAQDYQQRKERTAALTNLTLQSTDGMSVSPTPTQEENDLLALGLMHPDEKSLGPQDKAMPSLEAQRAYLRDGTALPTAPAATTAPRTTTTSGTTTSGGTSTPTSGGTTTSGSASP